MEKVIGPFHRHDEALAEAERQAEKGNTAVVVDDRLWWVVVKKEGKRATRRDV